MLAVTLEEEDQKDYTVNNNRRLKKIIQLEPGQSLLKVPGAHGAYLILSSGSNPSGKEVVELAPGEQVHFIPPVLGRRKRRKHETELPPLQEISPAGYIVQPSGAPTMNAYGVSQKIGRTIVWIHQLTRRGPLHNFGGLQGYVMSQKGDAWVPKRGPGKNGSEALYYSEDIDAWLAEYAPAQDIDDNRELPQPSPELYNFFVRLGAPEQKDHEYVTRSQIMQKAKLMTRYKEYADEAAFHTLDELETLLIGTPEYTEQELQAKFGLKRAITDNDYERLMYVAREEKWGRPPRMQHNTAAYRRRGRRITIS